MMSYVFKPHKAVWEVLSARFTVTKKKEKVGVGFMFQSRTTYGCASLGAFWTGRCVALLGREERSADMFVKVHVLCNFCLACLVFTPQRVRSAHPTAESPTPTCSTCHTVADDALQKLTPRS